MQTFRFVSVAVFAVLLVGCVRTYTPSPKFDVKTETKTGEKIALVSAEPIWRERDFDWQHNLKNKERGLVGFTFRIENLTAEPIIANWSKSSIHYGETISVALLDGQKFVDKNTPPNSSTIPPRAIVNKIAYPAYQIEEVRETTWRLISGFRVEEVVEIERWVTPIENDLVTLTIAIDTKGATHYYVLEFKRGELPAPIRIPQNSPL